MRPSCAAAFQMVGMDGEHSSSSRYLQSIASEDGYGYGLAESGYWFGLAGGIECHLLTSHVVFFCRLPCCYNQWPFSRHSRIISSMAYKSLASASMLVYTGMYSKVVGIHCIHADSLGRGYKVEKAAVSSTSRKYPSTGYVPRTGTSCM